MEVGNINSIGILADREASLPTRHTRETAAHASAYWREHKSDDQHAESDLRQSVRTAPLELACVALITGLSSLVSATPRSMAQSGVREGERLAVPIQWQLRTRDQSWAGGPWRVSGIRTERHKCASAF